MRDHASLDLLADADQLTQPPSPLGARATLLGAVGAIPQSQEPVAEAPAHGGSVADALRVAYRRWLVGIAVRDLSGLAGMESVAAWLSDLADATLEAALAIARHEVGESAFTCRLAIIGMGKCGGRELNYISDVDVIFVAEAADGCDESDALRAASLLAAGLMRVCSEVTAEGSIWEVDAALRPEGKQGALVRTLPSHLGYYERWASTWEFQALLKARFCAGDADLGTRYMDAISPMVWKAADRPDFVADVQSMRKRVEDHIPADIAEREIKLGPGGLRDVEFSVQLLQLVHGRGDVMLRSATTLVALEALATWGYVGRGDAAYNCVDCDEHTRFPKMTRSYGFSRVPSGCEVNRFANSSTNGNHTSVKFVACTRNSSTGRCWPPSRAWKPEKHDCPFRRLKSDLRLSGIPTQPGPFATCRR